jgi:hypothetical protein
MGMVGKSDDFGFSLSVVDIVHEACLINMESKGYLLKPGLKIICVSLLSTIALCLLLNHHVFEKTHCTIPTEL